MEMYLHHLLKLLDHTGTGASILGAGRLQPPDFWQWGVAVGRGQVVKYYYILSCIGSIRKWWFLKRN